MKEKPAKNREEYYSQVERRWVVAARPQSRSSAAGILLLILVLAALVVAIVINRQRIGALWQQLTGKAPPLFVQPEKPEREGPEIEGRDF